MPADKNPGILNRKERKKLARRLNSDDAAWEVLRPNAAGIDIGNETHVVSVPPDRDAEPVRTFGCFTEDLRRMAAWLKECGIETAAMQSTGVYWMPVYDVLEAAGLEVFLVNAQHTRNLPGRKTDVQESQWLRKLHSYGLLNNSFRPDSDIRILRAYWRQRNEHVQSAAQCIQRMQKALTGMNLQLANVISDLSGVTGQAIVGAILAGERDPKKLAGLRHWKIKAGEEEIAKSLDGTWREELIFALRQQTALHDFYQRSIGECDRELERHLGSLAGRTPPEAEGEKAEAKGAGKKRKKKTANAPRFDIAGELKRIAGVDLTAIDGVNVMTAQTVISEAGTDLSRWKTEAHFVSWLGLCPANDVSGGKVLRRRTRKVVNPLATALRMSAWALLRSQTYLGAQYRRLRTRLGTPKALTAMANKLGRLVYRLLTKGVEYVDKGKAFYEAKYRAQQVRYLTMRARRLGLQVVEIQAVAG